MTARAVPEESRASPGGRFALDRQALVRAVSASPLAERANDQFLPPASRPTGTPTSIRCGGRLRTREEARRRKNQRRQGPLYVFDVPPAVSLAQLVAQQLGPVGLGVQIVRVPPAALSELLAPGEPWDMAMLAWGPDFLDPFMYVNALYRFAPPLGGNFGGFEFADIHAPDDRGGAAARRRPRHRLR